VVFDHMLSASLGDEEGTGQVYVDKLTEFGSVIGFGFHVRASWL